MRVKYFLFALLLFSGTSMASSDFPICPTVRKKVDFWKKVYTEIQSYESFLHDVDDPSLIYKKLNYKGLSRRAKRRLVKREIRKLKNTMSGIIKKKKQNLNGEENLLLTLMKNPDLDKIKRMRRRIRSQQGMQDRYFKGLVRSFAFIDPIKKIFTKRGVPLELAWLPHVESSFNHRAYSKVGAAGMWQFMRSTARLYKLKMNYVIDERRDPFLSADAAARLLRDNYNQVKSWPLAVTAYNHGLASIKRAIRKLGTTSICTIIEKYEGRRFGFASKNFYATFMATVEISQDPKQYFKNIPQKPTIHFSKLKLPKSMPISQISKGLRIPLHILKELNPAIRRSVFRSRIYIPKGYNLQIPVVKDKKLEEYTLALNKIKVPKSKLDKSFIHVVSRGESLYTISRMYRVALNDIILLNNFINPRRIYTRMKIRIPGTNDRKKLAELRQQRQAVIERPDLDATELGPTFALDVSTGDSPYLKRYLDWWDNLDQSKDIVLAYDKPLVSRSIAEQDLLPGDRQIDADLYDLEVQNIHGNIYVITVEDEETLSNYADWALSPMHKIRAANRMGRRSVIRQGQKLKIPIAKKHLLRFNSERLQFHLAIEEDFYENYRLSGTTTYTIKRGDTIDRLTKKFDIPYWVLRKYQKGKTDLNLVVGQSLVIPQFDEIKDS